MRVSLDKIDTIKTCKSCKHYRYPLWVRMWAWATENKPRCNRTAPNPTIDVVSGKVVYPELDDSESCRRQREATYSGDCGPDAKHWIPKSKDGIFDLIKHTEDLNTK